MPTVLSKKTLCGNDGDSFVFITDTHIEYSEMHSPSLVKYVIDKANIRKIICGGDVMNGGSTKSEGIEKVSEWYFKMNTRLSPYPIYTMIGNHDINASWGQGSSAWFNDEEVYSLFVAPVEDKVNTDGKNYYYFDNPSQKIRYYILDGHWPDATNGEIIDNRGVNTNYVEQLNWLESTALELEAGWSIVVMQHIVYGLATYSGHTVISAEITDIGNMLISKLDAMADNANAPTIIGVICGHAHYDWHTYSVKGYPIVVSDCDTNSGADESIGAAAGIGGYYQIGTIQEHAFDIVNIDKTRRKLYFTRIGRGSDREFNY